jgi:FtsP/CotA-like multicopper oxidase with cupredoxin domain
MRCCLKLLVLLFALFFSGAIWSADQAVRVIQLEIAARAVSGPELSAGRPAPVLKLARGETVVLRWHSDEAARLHLHGYNIEARVPAGGTADMRLLARATGRFALETHGMGADARLHKTLLYVEVHPR